MPAQRLPITLDPVKALGVTPAGPGILLAEQIDFSYSGLQAAARGDESRGKHLGMLTSPPQVTVDPDTQNLLDGVVGLSGEYKNSKQPGTYSVEASGEVTEIEPDRMRYFQPGLIEIPWTNSAHASLTDGTGNARHTLTARASGTGGNSITYARTVPATTNAALSVSVSGSAITVSLATGATASVSTSTAKQVIDAINAHSGAAALVRGGLSVNTDGTPSDGSTVVGALAATNLAGGTAGSSIGSEFSYAGNYNEADYLSNVTMVVGTTEQDIYVVYVVRNAINVDSWNPQFDENGAVSGLGVTWRGHSDTADRNAVTGAIKPPVRMFLRRRAVAV